MEISISSEQDHLMKVAEKSAIPPLLESGNIHPSLFLHNGSDVKFIQFESESKADLDKIRESVQKTILKDHRDCLAYVLAYGSQITLDDKDMDALILETGDIEDEFAFEFFICYNRSDQKSEPRQVLSRLPSLVSELFQSPDNSKDGPQSPFNA